MELPASVAQFEKIDRAARRGLGAAQARDPRACSDFSQGTLHRLDLAQTVVALQSVEALFPEAAKACFHPRHANRRTIDLQVQAQSFGQIVGKTVCLRKQV